MPRRAMPKLPPDQRRALEDELRFHQELEDRAALDKYVRVSFAYERGMTTREIGDVMGVTSGTASRWKDWGEQERERRRREDPGGSGELDKVS